MIGTALMEGGPDRTIKLDRNPGIDEVIFHASSYTFNFKYFHFYRVKRRNWENSIRRAFSHVHLRVCSNLLLAVIHRRVPSSYVGYNV